VVESHKQSFSYETPTSHYVATGSDGTRKSIIHFPAKNVPMPSVY